MRRAAAWPQHREEEPDAVVQVYGARAYNWRGAFGIHTWIATKRPDADHYSGLSGDRMESLQRPLDRDREPRRATRFSLVQCQPELLAEHRGPGADASIDRIEICRENLSVPEQLPRLARAQQQQLHRLRGAGRFPSWVSTCRPRRSERIISRAGSSLTSCRVVADGKSHFSGCLASGSRGKKV